MTRTSTWLILKQSALGLSGFIRSIRVSVYFFPRHMQNLLGPNSQCLLSTGLGKLLLVSLSFQQNRYLEQFAVIILGHTQKCMFEWFVVNINENESYKLYTYAQYNFYVIQQHTQLRISSIASLNLQQQSQSYSAEILPFKSLRRFSTSWGNRLEWITTSLSITLLLFESVKQP